MGTVTKISSHTRWTASTDIEWEKWEEIQLPLPNDVNVEPNTPPPPTSTSHSALSTKTTNGVEKTEELSLAQKIERYKAAISEANKRIREAHNARVKADYKIK